MSIRPVVSIILALSMAPVLVNARNVSLINLRGGSEYFDGDALSAPREKLAEIPFSRSEEIVQLFEEAQLAFGEDVTIDRIDIHTDPGAQICYLLGHQTDAWTFDRYNGVPGFDIRADDNGVQSIPVNPPLRASFLSIQCFVKPEERAENAMPSEIDFYNQGERITLIAPLKKSVTVSASTTLTPKRVYAVDNLFDGELDTVWAEGAPGYGEGATITFNFDSPTRLTGLWFSNGHQRDDETFDNNGKLNEFSFAGETYTLKNQSGVQVIPLKKSVQELTFELKILSHYPGTKYKDLCLTEMGFKSGDTFIRPKTEGARIIAENNRRALKDNNAPPYSWRYGNLLQYVEETAHFSFSDPNGEYRFKGIARVVSSSSKKTVFDLEGYLDRADFDNYGNVITLKSRTAEKMRMTVTRPSFLTYQECEEILTKHGLAKDSILEAHKKYFGKPPPRSLEEGEDPAYVTFYCETWYLSPLGFQREKFESDW